MEVKVMTHDDLESYVHLSDPVYLEFHAKCFCKVAAGLELPDSTERILRIEGRDASLGLAARRIATALTKDLRESTLQVPVGNGISYQPRGWNDPENQVIYLNGRMDPTPGDYL